MILEFFHFDIPTAISLFIVIVLISGGVISSLVKTWWTRRNLYGKKKSCELRNEDVTQLV